MWKASRQIGQEFQVDRRQQIIVRKIRHMLDKVYFILLIVNFFRNYFQGAFIDLCGSCDTTVIFWRISEYSNEIPRIRIINGSTKRNVGKSNLSKNASCKKYLPIALEQVF